jgi:hypothetical protein
MTLVWFLVPHIIGMRKPSSRSGFSKKKKEEKSFKLIFKKIKKIKMELAPKSKLGFSSAFTNWNK